jgi:hypothetical protein
MSINTHVQADICQLGMDQRKVNVLARYASYVFRNTPSCTFLRLITDF